MATSYTKTNWQDAPSTATPITAAQLNRMEKGIEDCSGQGNANELAIAANGAAIQATAMGKQDKFATIEDTTNPYLILNFDSDGYVQTNLNINYPIIKDTSSVDKIEIDSKNFSIGEIATGGVEFKAGSNSGDSFKITTGIMTNSAIPTIQFAPAINSSDNTGVVRLTGIAVPTVDNDATNKKYVDDTSNNVKSYVNNNFANALKGSASGEEVRLNDVSPIEHELKIKLKSKNLFNAEAEPLYLIGAEKTLNGTALTFTSTEIMARYAYRIPTETGKQYTVSVKSLVSVPASGQSATGSDIFLSSTAHPDTLDYGSITSTSLTKTFTAKSDYLYIKQYVCYGTNQVGGKKTVDGLQVEEGASATSYAPYISDFSGVTLKRYGKNLLPYPYRNTNIDYTHNGINYKVKSDGTVVANGTATAQSYFILAGLVLNKGVYYLSGCPSGGEGSTYSIYFQYDNFSYYKADYGSGVKIDINEKKNCAVAINIGKNTTVSNLIFKPMLEVGSKLTDFEERRTAVAYTPAADGTISGVKNLYPTTTLMTDTEGVIIEAEYNRDINKAFAELQAAIISLGGNV